MATHSPAFKPRAPVRAFFLIGAPRGRRAFYEVREPLGPCGAKVNMLAFLSHRHALHARIDNAPTF
jgi:hypothetical protein